MTVYKNSLLCTDKEFLEVYERNVKRIYRICLLHLKNIEDAEDAVQTVFLKYIKSGQSFHDDDHEKAWFIVTAQNYCRDIFRLSWWRSRPISINDIPEVAIKEDNNDYATLMDALLKLPYKYKTIIYLYYFEGYSVKEISQMLRRNESTIRTQLSKGRERIKINLGGYYE